MKLAGSRDRHWGVVLWTVPLAVAATTLLVMVMGGTQSLLAEPVVGLDSGAALLVLGVLAYAVSLLLLALVLAAGQIGMLLQRLRSLPRHHASHVHP